MKCIRTVGNLMNHIVELKIQDRLIHTKAEVSSIENGMNSQIWFKLPSYMWIDNVLWVPEEDEDY